MPHEAPTTSESTPNREQTLADLEQMEDILADVKSQREQLATELSKPEKDRDEERVKALTQEIRYKLNQCHSLRRKIEGKDTTTNTIETDFIYTDTEGKEQKETITIDIEKEIEVFTTFYTKYTIETPPNFKEVMQDIWQRNVDQIKEQIEKEGFNTILLIPETLPNLSELNTKMSEGYDKTYENVKITDIVEPKQKARIVLLHNQELWQQPKLQETLGKKIETFFSLPDDQKLTLSDWLVAQRKIFDQTGEHIETKQKEDSLYYWTTLPSSIIPNTDKKGGFRVVCAHWYPFYGRLSVYANDPANGGPDLGCRLSRLFF